MIRATHTTRTESTTTTMSSIKITAADLCTLAADEGCNVLEQKSWFKITADENGKNRKAIYVAKSKRAVTKIHFSGFEPEECEVIKSLSKEEAKELKLGAVRGEIVTKGLTEEFESQIVDAFESNLSILLSEEAGFKLGRKEETKEEAPKEEVSLEGLGDLQMFDEE